MLTGPEPADSRTKTVWKNPLLYSSVVVGLALVVVAWIFFSRWQQNRFIEQKARDEKAQKQLENDRIALQQLGGTELQIQSFYASAGTIHRGESLQLCYGVANAKSVKLEPQDNPVWPSHARCVDVSPTKDTTFTLTISDATGNTKTATLEIKVR